MKGRLLTKEESLARTLNSQERIEAYLNSALEEDDPRVFLAAVRNVIKVKGGFKEIAETTKLSRESLYRTYSTKGNPRFDSFNTTLIAMGFKINIKADPKAKGRFKTFKVKKVRAKAREKVQVRVREKEYA